MSTFTEWVIEVLSRLERSSDEQLAAEKPTGEENSRCGKN